MVSASRAAAFRGADRLDAHTCGVGEFVDAEFVAVPGRKELLASQSASMSTPTSATLAV